MSGMVSQDVKYAFLSIFLSVLIIWMVVYSIHLEDQDRLHRYVDEKYPSAEDHSYIRYSVRVNQSIDESQFELMKRCSTLRFTTPDGIPVDIDEMVVEDGGVTVWLYMPKNTTSLEMYYGT